MTLADSCTIAGFVLTIGGILVYVGRSLGTMTSIGDGVKVALAKVDLHDKEIGELKVGLAEVKTRQEDCGNCP